MSGSLFSGSVIPPQPTASDASTSYPQWLQQYVYNLGNAATNLASQPYTQFPGQQIAAPSAATTEAEQLAQSNVGSYQPDLSQANALTGQAGALTQYGAGLSSQGAGLTNEGAGLTNQAVGMTEAASQPIGASQINQYMNPYTSQVVGALQQASNNNLTMNQLPAISSQFVGAGQAASPQMAQADNNALYLSNQALDQATAGALQTGYQGALSTALTEQGAQMQGASQIGQYGGQLGQYGSELGAIGQQFGQYGSETAAQGAQYGALGSLTQQMGGYDVGQLAASGQTQDTFNQANINSAINNFDAQQQWPYQNLAYASNIIRGQPVASNTYTVGLTPGSQSNYTASPLSSFIGTTLGGSALLNGTSGALGNSAVASSLFAKGGRVGKRRGALAIVKKAA